MEIGVQSIKKEEKPILRNLLELYQYDFSEFEGADVGDQGLFGYDYLDHYWTEPGRFAFFIRCGGNLAGFALVRDIPDGSDGVVHVLAEFFVMRKYRRQHVGQTAARLIFELFPGRWRVAQESCNYPAQFFWKQVINTYTRGSFKEVDYPGWDGPVQEFSVPPESVEGSQEVDVLPPEPGPDAVVSLREITFESLWAVCRLSDTLVGPQKYMVALNSVSIAQAHFSPQARYRAIYADETPVGFIMWHDGVNGENDWEEIPGYFLWRFMTGRPYQGKGYGRKALQLLVDELKVLGATELRVSCGTGPGSPEGFYRKFGFERDGSMFDHEVGLTLKF